MIEQWLTEAQRLYQQGRFEQALSGLRRALQRAPRDGRVHYLMASVLRDSGKPAEALSHAQSAAASSPQEPAIRYLLAQTLEDSKQITAAIEQLQAAVSMKPAFPEAHHYLGLLLADANRSQEALDAFQTALRYRPAYPRAWHNFGSLLRDLRRFPQAERAFREAIRLQPDYALAHASLGLLLRDIGQRQQAIIALSRSYELQPKRIETILALGNLLRMDGQYDAGLRVYQSGLNLDRQGDARVHMGLAFCLAQRGDTTEAKSTYRRAGELLGGDLRAAIGEALTLPPLYRDRAEIESTREEFGRGIGALRQRIKQWAGMRGDEVLHALQWSNFYLAYQGLDDRALQESYAAFVRELVEAVAPDYLQVPAHQRAHGSRRRIGFLSSFFTDSTVGHYFKRWLTELDPARFEVYAYQLRPGSNPIADAIAAKVATFRVLSGERLSEIIATIRADQLDLLVYPELGMDSTCFLLAALRLAPMQAAAWGHPVTSGHTTIDCYFSSGPMEPADAQAHYTERLLTLPGIGTSYPRPLAPPRATRQELGLPEQGELLLLPQSLYKIHPDNDSLVAHILARRPAAKVVLFNGRHENITRRLMTRLEQALTAAGVTAAGRLVLLPFMPRERYLQVNSACDLMLDTIYWSGGNTSLDALACQLPIVTLPGDYMRGRQSAAMLRLAGIPELVADTPEQYQGLVDRLLDEPEWRSEVVARIAAGAARLFDDPEPIAALERCFDQLLGGVENSPVSDSA